MAPPTKLSDDFLLWARARLRPLLDARTDDARGTGRRRSTFGALIKQYMKEYEEQPFAKSTFPGNTHSFTDDALREKAQRYLRNHSTANNVSQLASFEGTGGISDDNPFRATGATELWATGQKERIRTLVCAELGVAPDTPHVDLPANFIGVRRTVLKREFDLLPADEQEDWHTLARENKDIVDEANSEVIAVQDRQGEFSGQLASQFQKKTANGRLGRTFLLQWSGFYIGEEDQHIHRFRGQSSTYKGERYADTDAYKNNAEKPWTEWVRKEAHGYMVFQLKPLPDGQRGAELDQHRKDLTSFLEMLFTLVCNLPPPFDSVNFWSEVAEDPSSFVSPHRLPNGIQFGKPELMQEDDFIAMYQHVYACQVRRRQVPDDERFIFEKRAVDRAQATARADSLAASQAKKRLLAAAAAETASHAPPPAPKHTPPAPELDAPPAPEPDASPAPELDASPAPELDAPPAPERDAPPAPEVDAPPAPEPDAPPAPEVNAPRAPELHTLPAPKVDTPPAPEVDAARQPELDAARVPEVDARSVLGVPALNTTASMIPSNEATKKRKRGPSIPPAPKEQMEEMGATLGAGGYNTRHRNERRPVVEPPTKKRK